MEQTGPKSTKEYIKQENYARAEELLDRGMEVLPPTQIRFSEANTYPFLEAYYSIGAVEKGDALRLAYADTLIDYVEYYLQFDGLYGDMTASIIDEKLDELSQLYYLAAYADRSEVVKSFNDYYRSLGIEDKDLILTDEEKASAPLMPATETNN